MTVVHYSVFEKISRLVSHCVEHGIWSALSSLENHFEKLHWSPGTDAIEIAASDSHFEYWWLAFGLSLSFLCFLIELFVGVH